MLRDDQVAVLCDIAQSNTFSGAKKAALEELITEGYVIKDADGHKLTEKAETLLADRGVGLNEA